MMRFDSLTKRPPRRLLRGLVLGLSLLWPLAPAPGAARTPQAYSTPVADAGGRVRGHIRVIQTAPGELDVKVRIWTMPPGRYGLHLHAVGRCDGPDFASAGPHWNPDGRAHGVDNPAGAHGGDLPNLVVGPKGKGQITARLTARRPLFGAGGLIDADGAAIVLHAGADDLRTDPGGNSGPRWLCGALVAPEMAPEMTPDKAGA